MSDRARPVLSVLMPVYNEQRTLRAIVHRVLAAPIDLDIELICVDDCSTDRSWEVLQELAETDSRIRTFRHEINRGKGAAIRTAIAQVTGDIAVVQDSDLEYDPAEYPKLLRPILDGRADAVFGSRFAASPERRVLLYWHSLGNKLLTWLTNILNDLNLTDMETCYKAVVADVLKDLRLESDRFGIEPEITTRLAQWGARIYEVPITYSGRSYAEGKNIGWRDGLQALWLLFKFRFVDTRFSLRASQDAFETMAIPRRVSEWTLKQFDSYLGKRVLEAGCGVGNTTRHLLDREQLTIVDFDPYYVRLLDRRWGHLENVTVIKGDLEDPDLYEKLEGPFDSVVCINVLEHLDNPVQAVKGFAEVLRPGGHAFVLVPGHRWLFSHVDRAIGHRSRFTEDELRRLIESCGLHTISLQQFNRLAVAGWLLNKLTGSSGLRTWQMRMFGVLLPIARLVERIKILPGLSLVAIARKQ
jgi:glycosyltransferase involved in cell wall biosynthesis/phospholipid N-methyltransferase